MAACWLMIFINPRLGFNESLGPLFVTLFLISWATSIAGIVYFFVSQKTWHSIVCLGVSVGGLALNIFGFLYSIGSVVGAFM